MSEEQVLVVARERLPDLAGWYGLRTEGLTACLELIAHEGRYASLYAAWDSRAAMGRAS